MRTAQTTPQPGGLPAAVGCASALAAVHGPGPRGDCAVPSMLWQRIWHLLLVQNLQRGGGAHQHMRGALAGILTPPQGPRVGAD